MTRNPLYGSSVAGGNLLHIASTAANHYDHSSGTGSKVVEALEQQRTQLVRLQRVLLLVVLMCLGVLVAVIAGQPAAENSPAVAASSTDTARAATHDECDRRLNEAFDSIAALDGRLNDTRATSDQKQSQMTASINETRDHTRELAIIVNQSRVGVQQALSETAVLQATINLITAALATGPSDADRLLYAVNQIKEAFNGLDASLRQTRAELSLPEEPAILVGQP